MENESVSVYMSIPNKTAEKRNDDLFGFTPIEQDLYMSNIHKDSCP